MSIPPRAARSPRRPHELPPGERPPARPRGPREPPRRPGSRRRRCARRGRPTSPRRTPGGSSAGPGAPRRGPSWSRSRTVVAAGMAGVTTSASPKAASVPVARLAPSPDAPIGGNPTGASVPCVAKREEAAESQERSDGEERHAQQREQEPHVPGAVRKVGVAAAKSSGATIRTSIPAAPPTRKCHQTGPARRSRALRPARQRPERRQRRGERQRRGTRRWPRHSRPGRHRGRREEMRRRRRGRRRRCVPDRSVARDMWASRCWAGR